MYFHVFVSFEFVTFSKNQLFVELFQKRFAGGICDFRGASMYSATPYKYNYSVPASAISVPTPAVVPKIEFRASRNGSQGVASGDGQFEDGIRIA